MSDYPNSNSNSSRNRNRNRSRNRPRGPRPEGPRPTREGREREAPPSGFQKLLSVITFGLLGKSGSKNRPKPQSSSRPAAESAPRPQREPREQREHREPREPREPRQRREAPAVNPSEITTDRLYVGNLSYDAAESDLFELFNGVGAVRNAEVVVNSRTQRSKGFAFVTMGSVDEARRAVAELNGKDFMGRPLQLSGAKPNTRGDDPAFQEEEQANTAA